MNQFLSRDGVLFTTGVDSMHVGRTINNGSEKLMFGALIMDKIRMTVEKEESKASNHAMSIFITVFVNEIPQLDILDVDVFFASLSTPGISPLFTCDCGFFGCGGYYVRIQHNEQGYVLSNSYKPYDVWDENNQISSFHFQFSWEEIYQFGLEVYALLMEIHSMDRNVEISSGAYGLNLVEKMPIYLQILEIIEQKI